MNPLDQQIGTDYGLFGAMIDDGCIISNAQKT